MLVNLPSSAHTRTHAYTYTCIFTDACMHTCTHTHMHTDTHVYSWMHAPCLREVTVGKHPPAGHPLGEQLGSCWFPGVHVSGNDFRETLRQLCRLVGLWHRRLSGLYEGSALFSFVCCSASVIFHSLHPSPYCCQHCPRQMSQGSPPFTGSNLKDCFTAILRAQVRVREGARAHARIRARVHHLAY